MIRHAAFLLSFIVIFTTCQASDWPTARGDARSSGVAPGKISDSPEVRWTYAGEKDAFEATPVIADGVVYLGSLYGNFYALELKTGKVLWKFYVKLGFSAPAAVSGGRVFVGDGGGFFHALDAKTGEELWNKDVIGTMNAAPGFYEDRVLFTVESGELFCLDVKTGKEIWKYESTDQLHCGVTLLADTILLGSCDRSLQVVDAKTGELLKRLDVDAQTGATVAVNEAGCAFLGTMGSEVLGFSPEYEILWRYMPEDRRGEFRSNAAATKERVFIGGRNRCLTCLDAKTGEELWTFPTRRGIDTSPVVIGDRVLFHAMEGKIFLLDAADGKEVWSYETGGSLMASPAVADGAFITATGQGEVLCFE